MSDLLSTPVLVINQKAKLIELTNEYLIRDADGNEVGRVQQEGQSALRKVLRALTRFDQFMSVRLAVVDTAGNRVLSLHRGPAFWKSKVAVADGAGQPVGQIVQRNVIGKIRFGLEGPGGEDLGEIRGENWRAWDFAIVNAAGAEVGRVTKKWAGVAKELFTTADNYLFEVSDPSVDPRLRQLMLASAAAIDTALKQNDR